ncbi:MAG: FMN-binding negative transcriptional regulator [Acidobacteria bacterium]|nr:FMN-binding negative transcriptional regulator [Acidobacteriota bacterium]
MLKSKYDVSHSDQEWRDFLLANDFGQLIATGRDREQPVVTPTHFIFDGQSIIELHVHRLNPVIQAIYERNSVLFSVIGAYVYIPTQWNVEAGTDPEWSIPTSYYAAVQAAGQATIVDDPGELSGLLNRQMRHFQPEGGYHPVEPGMNPHGRMLGAICGVRISIQGVEAKFKFGGNRMPAHRTRVAACLAARGARGDAETLFHLVRREKPASFCPEFVARPKPSSVKSTT